MGDKRKFTTSDVNFTAYLTYHNVPIKNTTTSREGNRIRVWFEFEMEEAEFTKHKNDFFSQSEESKVTAQRLFQERDRVYSLMIQVRNSVTT
jgi:regulatory protein YycH of two-component signal transduction system YycFG